MAPVLIPKSEKAEMGWIVRDARRVVVIQHFDTARASAAKARGVVSFDNVADRGVTANGSVAPGLPDDADRFVRVLSPLILILPAPAL